MQCNAHFKCKSNKQRSVAKWKWSESKNGAAWTKRKRRMAATNIYKRYKYIKNNIKYTNALRNVGKTYSNEIQVPGIFLSTSKMVWSVEKMSLKGLMGGEKKFCRWKNLLNTFVRQTKFLKRFGGKIT